MGLVEDGESPKALAGQPEMFPHLEFTWRAFNELSGDRAMGMGAIGQIPFSSIDRYASRYGIEDPDEFQSFHRMIAALDTVYLKHHNHNPESGN